MSTFAELTDDVMKYAKSGDSAASARMLNDAVRHISMLVPYNITVATLTAATSKARYSFSSDFSINNLGVIRSIQRNDTIRNPVLEYIDPSILLGAQQSASVGSPRYYSQPDKDNIFFWPYPAVGQTFTMYYVADYVDQVEGSAADGTSTFVDSSFQDLVVFRAASRLAVMESVELSIQLWNMYKELLNDYRIWFNTRGGGPGRLFVGYPQGALVPYHTNDIALDA